MILQKELKRTSVLKKAADGGDVPEWALVKMLEATDRMHDIHIDCIRPVYRTMDSGQLLWSAKIVETGQGASRRYCGHGIIYGTSLYEVLTKSVLKMRAVLRLRRAQKMEETEHAKTGDAGRNADAGV